MGNPRLRRRVMKKLMVVCIYLFCFTNFAYTMILTTGDVDPADPATWDSTTAGSIGNTGHGTMDITGGGVVSNGVGSIGVFSTGEVTVDGAGSTWTNGDGLYIGNYGNGTLNITNGGAVNVLRDTWLSTGEVTVDGAGSTWTNSDNLRVGYNDGGTLNITDGGLVSVAGILTIDYDGDGDGFINMDTGGMLALFGDTDDSLADFLDLIDGTDAINYWDDSISDWANIAYATYGVDYTLSYITEGDLADYTMLTVPEPATVLLVGLGGLALLRKRRA